MTAPERDSGSTVVAGTLLFPPFEVWKKQPHLFGGLFPAEFLCGIPVKFFKVHKAVFYHLIHRYILSEPSIPETVRAIFRIGCSVTVRSEYFAFNERHSAALTKFIFHNL